jgi:E3 ubiquitin-protein ligase RNF25
MLKAQELLESSSPMLFELIELARDLLTTNNVPKTECMVCLIPFGEEDEDGSVDNAFMKTHCFHYFHRNCLAEWVRI